jgi:hypothetical protein
MTLQMIETLPSASNKETHVVLTGFNVYVGLPGIVIL